MNELQKSCLKNIENLKTNKKISTKQYSEMKKVVMEEKRQFSLLQMKKFLEQMY